MIFWSIFDNDQIKLRKDLSISPYLIQRVFFNILSVIVICPQNHEKMNFLIKTLLFNLKSQFLNLSSFNFVVFKITVKYKTLFIYYTRRMV